MSWLRVDNHICIKVRNQIAHLNAVDVYDAMNDAEYEVLGEVQPPIQDAMDDIYFSSFNKCADVRIYSEESCIKMNISVDGVDLDFVEGQVLDQIIINNEWFYVLNAEDINTMISGLNITSSGQIDVNQYFELFRRNLSLKVATDTVDITSFKKDTQFMQPEGLNANLFNYQKDGYTWMTLMMKATHGCILGDEMGLGKTLQAISMILDNANNRKRSLVVAPVSLLTNWETELTKFAPKIKKLIHHGTHRTGNPNELNKYDCIITSYSNAVSDNSLLNMVQWDLMILDEAQNIKSPSSKRTKSIKDISAINRLAVTGTPFENHMSDIWSLIDFISPGYLGTEREFKKEYEDDIDGAEKIEPILSSLMIRRLVKDVAQDLPEKVVIPQVLQMSNSEIDLYERIRSELVNSDKLTLPLLTKLRMFCTHPTLQDSTIGNNPYETSIKYQRCCEILEEIFERKEKAIIFTSYTEMFDIFASDIPNRFGIDVKQINGATPSEDRQPIVDWFNNLDKPALLVLNPRAAGTGLNITGANHVIHYNLEWNPSLEDQASARAYRRGQKKTVFVYRLFYKDTVEEIVNQRIEKKRDMAASAVVGAKESDYEDILAAINMSPRRN